jgi:hypothetical protein
MIIFGLEMMFTSRCLAILGYLAALFVCGNTQSLYESGISGQRPLGGRNLGAAYQIDPHLNVDFSSENSSSSVELLKTLNNLDATTVWITISKVSVTGYPSLGNWTLLESVFSRLQSVQEVRWSAWKAISPRMLYSLEQNSPSCRLYYTLRLKHHDPHDSSLDPEPDYDPYDNPRDKNHELRQERERNHMTSLWSIINSTNLYSLQAHIEYGSDDEYEPLKLVFDTLSTAPNLRELDLKFETRGCLLGNSPFAFDFLSHPSVRFPPLEILKLSSYDLDERSDGGYAWSWVDFVRDERSEWNYEIDGFPPQPIRPAHDGRSNLDAWLEVMDWSHLHALEITNPTSSALDKLRGRVLPSLKHFALRGAYEHGGLDLDMTVAAFIRETALPLESLFLQNFKADVWSPLLIFMPPNRNIWKELKHFGVGDEENKLFLEPDAIAQLLTSAPRLESFDINLDRSLFSSWNLTDYDTLVSSPTLRHLSLRFPSPDHYLLQYHDNETLAEEYRLVSKNYDIFSDGEDQTDPIINQASVSSLFIELRKQKRGMELGSLDVHVGNWDSRAPCGSMLRPKLRIALYECRIDAFGLGEICEGKQTRSAGWL